MKARTSGEGTETLTRDAEGETSTGDGAYSDRGAAKLAGMAPHLGGLPAQSTPPPSKQHTCPMRGATCKRPPSVARLALIQWHS